MSKRNKRTNILLDFISMQATANQDYKFPVTLNVEGQIITGVIISPEEFFQLDENKAIADLYNQLDKMKSKYFDKNGLVKDEVTDEQLDNAEDWLFQKMLYLKDASYVTPSSLIPVGGYSMQVRVADISCLSIGRLAKPSS